VIKNLSVWSIIFGVGTTAAFAQPAIERLAPADSVVVVSIKDFQSSMERLERTGLWALWQSDQMKALRADALEKGKEHLDEILQELGVDEESLVAPHGPLGFAVFPGTADRFNASEPGFLVMADYGPQAFKMSRLIDAVIAKADEEGDVEYRLNEVLGRTVYSFDLSDLELDGVFELEDDRMNQMPQMPVPDPTDVLDVIEKLHYVRDGNRFMLCSDLGALTEALEVLDGEDRAGLENREDFQAVLRQLGEVDGYGVLLTRDIARMLGGGDPMAMMIQGMIQAFLGDIRALGAGVRLDGPASMVEETFAVYMPNGKAGLTALMDTGSPRRDPPPFVGPDAIAYSRMNFEFNGIINLLREMGRANPMLQVQIDSLLLDHGETIDQVTSALGPEVHSVLELSRPIDLSSLKTLYAIRSSRPEQLDTLLAQHAPKMGLEPRDFLGNRVYSISFNPLMMAGPMMPGAGGDGYSIGFGGGHVMIGTTSLVEDALRASGKADLPTLADDPDYRRALAAIPAENTVAWGVMDLVEYLDFFKDFDLMLRQQMIEQMKQWNPEYADEMQAELEDQEAAPWRKFDTTELKRYLGPVVWEFRATDDGFVGTSHLLAPAAEE
jgi:hypothetical protein